MQVLFLQLFQLLRVLSFQDAKLVTPPVIRCVRDVQLPQQRCNVSGLGQDQLSVWDFPKRFIQANAVFSFLS